MATENSVFGEAVDPAKAAADLLSMGSSSVNWLRGVNVFSPKEGSHVVRILPTLKEDRKQFADLASANRFNHIGIKVKKYFLRGVGVEFLSPDTFDMSLEDPCQKKSRALKAAGDEEGGKALYAYPRWVVNVLDGSDLEVTADAGGKPVQVPKLKVWALPKVVLDEITSRSKPVGGAGSLLAIESVTEGCWFSFNVSGSGINTKYVNFNLMPPSAIEALTLAVISSRIRSFKETLIVPTVSEIAKLVSEYSGDSLREGVDTRAPEGGFVNAPTSNTGQVPNVGQAPVNQVPISQVPNVGQAPISQVPNVGQAPISQAPISQAPVNQVQGNQVHVNQVPVNQVPNAGADKIKKALANLGS